MADRARSTPYHGGHSLADRIYGLYRLGLSLSEVQDELDRQIASREIVLLRELPKGWYLEWANAHEEGAGWARHDGGRIMIMISGKQHDPAEFRYHEPQPPACPEPIVEEEPPPPDADPPAIETEEPAA